MTSKKLAFNIDNKEFHLGYSRIAKFLECPRQYKFTYIDGIRGKATTAMKRGTAYHAVLEHALQYKIDTDKLISIEVLDKLAIKFAKQEELSTTDTKSVIQASRFWYDEKYQNQDPIAVEFNFDIVIKDIKLTGRIDQIDKDGWVLDHKFSSDIWGEERSRYGPQPIVYQWAAMQQLEKLFPNFKYKGFAYQIVKLYPNPMIQTIKIPMLSLYESEWWEDQLIEIANSIKNGIFPANPKESNCKWCNHKKLCNPPIYNIKTKIVGNE